MRRALRRLLRDSVTSKLARLILLANLTGLGVLILGVLWTSGIRESLIQARAGVLRSEAHLLRNILEATVDDDVTDLDPAWVREIMRDLRLPPDARVRVFDAEGELLLGADSFALTADIRVEELPPPAPQAEPRGVFGAFFRGMPGGSDPEAQLRAEVEAALAGETPAQGAPPYTLRRDADGEIIISVALPVRIVERVRGVVVAESFNFNDVVENERATVMPFIAVAVAVTLLSSAVLTIFIARPVRALALAADRVREQGPRRACIPDLSGRGDEIGELSVALSTMTAALADRIDTIERFAADVAHEVKNPLTSMRSALETLAVARRIEQQERLIAVMQHDVSRIDRLITDISSASKLDAEVARAPPAPVDLRHAVETIVSMYEDRRSDGAPRVAFQDHTDDAPIFITGFEEPLGHVLRNLIDNAVSFSPPAGVVLVRLAGRFDERGSPRAVVTIDDDGPGIADGRFEKIFERFYTERPQGSAFGAHSGLGLAICKQIVEAMRGRIWAENRIGADGAVTGARFSVLFPLRAS